MDNKDILKEAGLKVTPQRLAVLKAIYKLDNHPTADDIITYIRKKNPNVSTGTVYNILETFEENKIVEKVKTKNGIMRYDGFSGHHHHLYCVDSNRIEDYEDEELDKLIILYFENKKITNFNITDIKLQINGNFKD